MAPCILLCFSNTGVSVVTGDEQCHNLLIQNSELCYQSSLLLRYGGRWPTHTIVGTLYSVGDLFRGGTYRRVAAGVKMVSSQPAGKQSLLKSSHGLEKVGSRRRREDDMGRRRRQRDMEFWRTITTDNMISGFFFIGVVVQLHSQV